MFNLQVVLVVLGCCSLGRAGRWREQEHGNSPSYGLDVSFPMTHSPIEEPNVLGNRQSIYNDLVDGCSKAYDQGRCLQSEQRRFIRNARRPAVLRNFTEQGFSKIRAPPELWSLIQDFWNQNAEGKPENWELESWQYAESTVNHWQSPTYFVSVHNSSLVGGGQALEQKIWDSARHTLEAWTGQRLVGCSLYGIRIYTENSILHTHVDRIPLISSAILNVAQDTDEPWPLEVIGHDGLAHNVTMEPGDMVLYESHSILHGRPFALKGRYMANIFVHFEVLKEGNTDRFPYINYDAVTAADYQKILQERSEHVNRNAVRTSMMHNLAGNGKVEEMKLLVASNPRHVHVEDGLGWTPLHEAARGGHIAAIHFLLGQGANINALAKNGATPVYVAEIYNGVESAVVKYLQSKGGIRKEAVQIPTTLPHQLAGNGEIERLQHVVNLNHRVIDSTDANGWTPLHEAARGGHVRVVDYLLRQGAELNRQTKEGGTPLYYAARHNGKESSVFHYLTRNGGLHLGPEL